MINNNLILRKWIWFTLGAHLGAIRYLYFGEAPIFVNKCAAFLYFSEKEYPICKLRTVDLPRHMKKVHGWSKESSSAVTGIFGLRKKPPGKSKYRHKEKLCPLPNCIKVTKNVGEHLLSKIHGKDGMVKGSSKYYALIKSAKPYNASAVLLKIENSPRSQLCRSVAVEKGSRKQLFQDISSESSLEKRSDDADENSGKEVIEYMAQSMEDETNTIIESEDVHQLLNMFLNYSIGPERKRDEDSMKMASLYI